MPAWISSGVKIQVLGDPAWKMNIASVIVSIIKLALKLYFQNHYYGFLFVSFFSFFFFVIVEHPKPRKKRRNKSKKKKN